MYFWISVYTPWRCRICANAPLYVWRDWFVPNTWLIHTCTMTHSYICHVSFVHVPWLIHTCAMTHSYICHDSLTCIPCRIHTSNVHVSLSSWNLHDLLSSWNLHDSFICLLWLTHMHPMSHSYVECVIEFVKFTLLIEFVTHSYVCHDSFTCISCRIIHRMCHWVSEVYMTHWVRDSFIYLPWLIHMHLVSHSYVECVIEFVKFT